ncbi:sugar MFS transporter [Streptomyces sp. TP-A0356]|uniref:MFS transporter n=1 Tax=Streptomyces sp. TP-A0356 TaxID=1359208 RepID=UPI0007C73973|nr:MFS transporter [Streptomyces sp. TP-A0356]
MPTARRPDPSGVTQRQLTALAIVASCVAFVVIGALQALYGPAIPQLRKDFGVSPGVAGLSLSGHFAAAVVGVLVYHVLCARLGHRVLLGASYLLMALGAVLFAVAPNWPLALAGTFVIGLGFGGVDYGLNQLFAGAFGRRSTAMLNVLNGHFGVGAIAGPALVGWLGAEQYPAIFVGVAVVCVLILFTLGGVAARDPELVTETASGTGARVAPIIAAFIGIYVLHVAIETGVGGWEPTHLETVGYGAAAAATATSAYWAAMTIGRFVVVPLCLRFSAPAILTVCCMGMAGFLLLATLPSVAPYAYFGVGLAIAPIFPTCLPWLDRAVPSVAAAGAYVMAASMIGGVAFPPLLGVVIDSLAIKALPLVLLALASVCLLLSLWLRKNAPDPDGLPTSSPGPVGAASPSEVQA